MSLSRNGPLCVVVLISSCADLLFFQAFKDYRIIPRMLVDANKRDLSVTLFGVKYSVGSRGFAGKHRFDR